MDYDSIEVALEVADFYKWDGFEVWQMARAAMAQDIERSFATLLALAERLGFTEQDIIDTYNEKNKTNHDRSDSECTDATGYASDTQRLDRAQPTHRGVRAQLRLRTSGDRGATGPLRREQGLLPGVL